MIMEIPEQLKGQEVKSFIDIYFYLMNNNFKIGETTYKVVLKVDSIARFYKQEITPSNIGEIMEKYFGIKLNESQFKKETKFLNITKDRVWLELLTNEGIVRFPMPITLEQLISNLLQAGIKGMRWK